jgi:hypothetical protein
MVQPVFHKETGYTRMAAPPHHAGRSRIAEILRAGTGGDRLDHHL